MARGKSVRLLASIPERYSPDFMDRLDKRTVLGRSVLERYGAVMADLGGEDALSTVKRSLVRRFVWFETMLEGIECRAAQGEEIDIGSWTQLTNSWLGIARLLGLERQQKPAQSLADYFAAQDAAEATDGDQPQDDAEGVPEEIAAERPAGAAEEPK